MSLLAFGVNHNTAPVELRERISFGADTVDNALSELTDERGIDEAAILSTCNRTEVYCSLEADRSQLPILWFSDFHGLKQDQLRPFLYQHPDAGAVKHVLRVASGLDSMVLGEPQVLGQLKQAYQTALGAGSIGKLLSRLFQHSFRVAKQIRSSTMIGTHPVSVAFAAVRLAQQIFGNLSGQTVLLIGAGDTIELAARHLHENGLRRMLIANRTLERSQHLAAEYSAFAMTLGDIPKHIAEADIIISSTASQLPILGKGAIERAIRERKHRPMFLVDIAVPRDIEPEAGELEDVYLYTVDDLKEVIRDNLRSRQQAARQAEEIIDTQVTHFMDWLNSLDAVSTIRAMRDQADVIHQEVLRNAQRKLDAGADPQLILQEVTRTLTNKLLHSPSSQLRTAGMEGRSDLLSAAQEIFNLESELKSRDREK
ncbi:MAG TPA: glutamyl-tRNA reductase [Gammaproteobacteria bacterium]|nr:glutamyl-tRNA reductase [Gammaproteobacteria bacterium]